MTDIDRIVMVMSGKIFIRIYPGEAIVIVTCLELMGTTSMPSYIKFMTTSFLFVHLSVFNRITQTLLVASSWKK